MDKAKEILDQTPFGNERTSFFPHMVLILSYFFFFDFSLLQD
jgi:hypothetical protein